jgi:hypothetical protein
MAQSVVPSYDGAPLRLLSPSLARVCDIDVEPAVKGRMLRDLAALFRIFGAQAGNPAIRKSRSVGPNPPEDSPAAVSLRRSGRHGASPTI